MKRIRSTRAALLAAASVAVLTVAVSPASGSSGGVGVNGGSGGTGAGSVTPASAAGVDGVFPVVGHHTYGDGLGAGRGHQGQDLLAKCGKPVVAATAGRVRVVDYQASGAGNYVVVHGEGRTYDYTYFHMLRKPQVSVGDRLQAGDQIGLVGSTGESSACHLHFEMWSAPGWYRGGSLTNPTPFLKRWDHGG